ncbi:MAG: methyltransferase domain-containing protein [Alphaproteobacteria bacterium]|nr:methyltransferase domain-containing protein [Alphaproteobacteria bacterium]
MSDAKAPFDRGQLRRRRERAAQNWDQHNFLVEEMSARLVDRLDDINRDFSAILDLGRNGGEIATLLAARGGAGTLVECDISPAMLALGGGGDPTPAIRRLAADEELLPFADHSFDLVLSCLALHRVNDLPGTLIQIRRVLRPDGLFLGCFFGGGTLGEMRAAWTEAEISEEGGASPRVAPFVDIRDAGMLLQRAGFALPVVDSDTLTVRYENAFDLMHDLRGMGDTNILRNRRAGFTRRATLMAMADHYKDMFVQEDGRFPASFEVITLTAWAPDPSQPKPLEPGSATASLADAVGEKDSQKS